MERLHPLLIPTQLIAKYLHNKRINGIFHYAPSALHEKTVIRDVGPKKMDGHPARMLPYRL